MFRKKFPNVLKSCFILKEEELYEIDIPLRFIVTVDPKSFSKKRGVVVSQLLTLLLLSKWDCPNSGMAQSLVHGGKTSYLREFKLVPVFSG